MYTLRFASIRTITTFVRLFHRQVVNRSSPSDPGNRQPRQHSWSTWCAIRSSIWSPPLFTLQSSSNSYKHSAFCVNLLNAPFHVSCSFEKLPLSSIFDTKNNSYVLWKSRKRSIPLFVQFWNIVSQQHHCLWKQFIPLIPRFFLTLLRLWSKYDLERIVI
jgi:hypothetical protein